MKVFPVRYTDDAPAMQRFLEALGLTTSVASDGGGWIALESTGGAVGLHTASGSEQHRTPGDTELSFESEEPLEAVQSRLSAAGFDSEVIDESYGRSLRIIDPDGRSLQINEAMTDDYGYRRD